MKVFLVYLALCLCTACEANILYERTVTVVFPPTHQWQKASHTPLWATLVYTDGRGNLKHVHIPKGQYSCEVVIRRDCLTVFCVYPLSYLYPYGGFYVPSGTKTVSLTQEKGALAKLLLDNYSYNPEAVSNINAPYLDSLIGDASLVDGKALVLSLLNGVDEQIVPYEKMVITLSELPQGYWVPERESQKPFWSYWGKEAALLTEGGVQRFLNREDSLCITLFVDLKNQKYLMSLRQSPFW